MVRCLRAVLLTLAALASGCLPTDFLQPEPSASTATAVQSPLFATPSPVVSRFGSGVKSAPSSPEITLGVDKIGRQIVASNPSIGMKPTFSVIGSPQSEIFHQDTVGVFITEGLVRQCKSEGQLAAILSVELGRMAAERAVSASPESINPEKRPPIAVAMGNSGQFSGLEQLQQEETAKLGADVRRPSKRFVPPDPMALARGYLEGAGYDKRELQVVAPLMAQAERTYVIEKQFNNSGEIPR